MIAGLSKLGLPILTAARWLNIVLFGVFIFSTGFLISILSKSPWIAVPAVIVILVFPVILDLYSGIMTEPLFLAATVGGLLLIVLYLESLSRWQLIAAALLCGIATITRFIGAALLPVGVISVWVFTTPVWKRKLGDAVLFAGVFFVSILPWNIWYLFHQDTSALLERPRWSSAWDYLQPVRAGLVNVLWDWIPFHSVLPVQRYIWKVAVLGVMVSVFFVLTAWSLYRLNSKKPGQIFADRDLRIIGVMLLFVVSFLALFIFIYLFRNPPQDIDERTLLPLFPPLILASFALISLLSHISEKVLVQRGFMVLVGVLCLAGLFSYGITSKSLLTRYHTSGSGYTAQAWHSSALIEALQKMDPATILISNDTGAILFFTGRMGLEIKELHAPEPLTAFSRFGDDPSDETQGIFRDQGAALVLFQPAFYWEMQNLYQDETDARLERFTEGLIVYGEYPDGAIYFYPK
jgi:4-amino-4-deoxy-L-arabinose transferase-like glycosyltransferase